MVNTELKNILIERIMQINNKSFLEALKVLTDSKVEKDNYKLSDFEKKKIYESRQEGSYIDHQTALNEIDKWLKK